MASPTDTTPLLQEGLSCAAAVLAAIDAADLLANTPSDPIEREKHIHATWLLDMLMDKIAIIQAKIDEIDAAQVRA